MLSCVLHAHPRRQQCDGRASLLVAGLSETIRRGAGVDLRAKQAYAERLRAQDGGVSGAADATVRTVSML